MYRCYKIMKAVELIDYLKKQGRDPLRNLSYQLKTNLGFVHELQNGEVAFFDNHFLYEGILFENKKCFEDIIKADRFPVENAEKTIYEFEEDRIKSFHLQAEHFRIHLNTILKFEYPQITKEAAKSYLKKVIGRSIKKLTTPNDIIALISIIGQLVKEETNGKWFLVKQYGSYNPIYEPYIVTDSGNVITISHKVLGFIKWRVSTLENIFTDIHSTATMKITWERFFNDRPNRIILLE
jgi:hypothetical protein